MQLARRRHGDLRATPEARRTASLQSAFGCGHSEADIEWGRPEWMQNLYEFLLSLPGFGDHSGRRGPGWPGTV